MDSSPGFGSAAPDWTPCSDSLSLRLALKLNLARHEQLAGPLCKKYAVTTTKVAAPTACRRMVSGTVSPPLRGTFHLSLTVLVRYRSPLVFSLAGWSPRIRSGFHVSGSTQGPEQGVARVSPTGLSPSTAEIIHPGSATRAICNSPAALRSGHVRPYNPGCATAAAFHAPGLGSSPFARHYSGNREFLSFPPGTKMYQFPGFPPRTLCVQVRVTGHYPRRVPPFGDPRITARLRLPVAYRSLPRPSSASGA